MHSRLLVLSNGHGEDLIALRVIRALRQRRPDLELVVLPLVGQGLGFAAAEAAGELALVGPRRPLPSGGFSNQSLRGLLADLRAGLPLNSWRQFRIVRRWGRRGDPILAIGDLLPLLLAWSGGSSYGFIGTPKSDYTWRSGPGRHWPDDRYHRCKGSEWDPWEWALMRTARCRLVAMRDGLTARGLLRRGVQALAPGNPMMDGFTPLPVPSALARQRRVVLLGGSRLPEALRNVQHLLQALALLRHQGPIVVLCPTGARPTAGELAAVLRLERFVPTAPPEGCGASAAWQRGEQMLLIGEGCFQRWAPWGEVGLATAGTATEQLVGLGIPALSLPGPGPQFQKAFARRQSRLLGGAVRVCPTSQALAEQLARLLASPSERRALGRIGQRRMGKAGGSERLAGLVERKLLDRQQG
ncbi:lipid-A-disaccharide synthase-related protein [Synechococcus sp. CS-1325]|uniref:lipid-A-disaccharide synthase-related protein n=1 Tax=unclassified Synechococcus TaxID=2626047 RepID=UPI000DAFFEAC|nr:MULTISPECIES: lipid-A-disaccharide synthase-related protein [unclassified Synechococcus]MCT0198091.1 lipid-A-disaccharide synthase-related protein [Synechococcus sp. CS-1325]MCT0213814.1 lipid-A-disaccharide synthase-related protein [Synechococcus sp. CS-1326]MCT0233844.1 lipid-A-disaccharide synthase-related protein [Synechococcus sp. CS-1327]PZU97501.1 MAG: sugar synthetase [Cyanobium sp.]